MLLEETSRNLSTREAALRRKEEACEGMSASLQEVACELRKREAALRRGQDALRSEMDALATCDAECKVNPAPGSQPEPLCPAKPCTSPAV